MKDIHIDNVVKEVRYIHPDCAYDDRGKFFTFEEPSYDLRSSEYYRIYYTAFKHCVAKVLQPQTICEIGVFSGGAALAFLQACPSAHYVGIDADPNIVRLAKDKLDTCGFSYEIIIADSMTLKKLPQKFDLVHVDGDHTMAAAYNDMKLALESGSSWILVDDVKSQPGVMAGAFKAIVDYGTPLEWRYFDESHNGDLLVRAGWKSDFDFRKQWTG